MCFVLEDSLFKIAGHSDVENASLAGENVDVVDLGHVWRLLICYARVSDGCHFRTGSVPNRDSCGAMSS